MDISIIIVVYNDFDKVRNCLRSIFAGQFDGLRYEVIVVDNASAADAQVLRDEFPAITLIKNSANVGMGAGNNIGAKAATGEYLLILNADTELQHDTAKLLHQYLVEHETAGLVGPKLLYPDGTRQDSCYRFPRLFMPLFRRTFIGRFNQAYLDDYLMKNFDLDKVTVVDWLMGSCFMLSRALFSSLGGFDERFFMYFEDTDLCRRVHESGKRVVYLPMAVVVHHHGRASAKSHWLTSLFRNRMARVHLASYLKFFIKWGI